MITEERQKGDTPNGGVQSLILYQDEYEQPTDKSQAVQAVIHELNEKGESIHRNYMQINNKQPA